MQAYFQKHDGTGTLPFDTDKTTKLNNAAIKLVQTIPDAQCANFKVYDYGFTPISQYTKGGYAEDFEYMKLDARGADRKDFYLLFAREVDQNNHCIKIWVDVFLPDDGKFACLTATQRSLVKIRVEKAVAKALAQGPDNNPPTMNAELVGINTMQGEVEDIVNCDCDKGRNHGLCTKCLEPSDISSILAKYGHSNLYAEIESATSQDVALPMDDILYDFADVKIKNDLGTVWSLAPEFLAFLKKSRNEGANVIGILTSDENSCFEKNLGLKNSNDRSGFKNSIFETAENLFNETNGKMVFWLHCSKKQNTVHFRAWDKTENSTDLLLGTGCHSTQNNYELHRRKIIVSDIVAEDNRFNFVTDMSISEVGRKDEINFLSRNPDEFRNTSIRSKITYNYRVRLEDMKKNTDKRAIIRIYFDHIQDSYIEKGEWLQKGKNIRCNRLDGYSIAELLAVDKKQPSKAIEFGSCDGLYDLGPNDYKDYKKLEKVVPMSPSFKKLNSSNGKLLGSELNIVEIYQDTWLKNAESLNGYLSKIGWVVGKTISKNYETAIGVINDIFSVADLAFWANNLNKGNDTKEYLIEYIYDCKDK